MRVLKMKIYYLDKTKPVNFVLDNISRCLDELRKDNFKNLYHKEHFYNFFATVRKLLAYPLKPKDLAQLIQEIEQKVELAERVWLLSIAKNLQK